MDSLEEQSKQFFSNAKLMKADQRDFEYDRIKQDYYKTLEDAEEKVHLANQIYELVDKYLRRLDQELQKFKIELEADNAGITEILERRSLELDNPPPIAVNHVREKRKYTFHNTNSNNNVSANTYSGPHDRTNQTSSSDKVLSTIAQEVYRGAVANTKPLSAGPGIITSSNITSNRLNANAFTPLLAVVNANNSYPNGSTSANNSSLIPSNPSVSATEKGSPSNPALPHGSFRCNLGNTAIAAAASQAIAATQQMQMGRRTASLKASYEAINSGFSNIYSFNPLRDHSSNDSSNSHPDLVNQSSNALGYGYDSNVNKSGRATKRSRSSHCGSDAGANSHISITNSNIFEDNSSEAVNSDNNGGPDWTLDPNEPRYCICNQVSYGDMVACDNEDCQKEWFHYGCVGITQPPKGKWYCPDCSDKLNRRKGRKERS